jgi:general stress protein YciG
MEKTEEGVKPTRKFYVYILFDFLGQPRYVGKGTGDRWLRHERKTDPVNILKNSYIEQATIVLDEVPKIKVRENLTEKEAYALEVALIKAIGRYPVGPLCNMTAGGDGLDTETARKLNAARPPEQRRETARKAGAASAAARDPEERRAAGQKGGTVSRAALTPAQRSEASQKAATVLHAKLSPAQRSAAARKANAALTPAQRTENARKANATRWAARSPEERRAEALQSWQTRRQKGTTNEIPTVRIEAIIAALRKNPNALQASRLLGESYKTVRNYAKKAGIELTKGAPRGALVSPSRLKSENQPMVSNPRFTP